MTDVLKKFPIRDVQFHEGRLRFYSADDYTADEQRVLIEWHTTALEFLRYGALKKTNGPAADYWVDGVPVPMVIFDYLILRRDAHGQPYFQHVFKGTTDGTVNVCADDCQKQVFPPDRGVLE